MKLTLRQEEVLELIRSEIIRTGFPPTRAEIARALGFRSANAAEDHLRALARKGAIELTPGASRGIRLLDEGNTSPMFSHEALSNAKATLLLPIVGRVAAGSPILAHEHIEGELSVQSSLFSPQANYLLRVRGDSMTGAGILDGDLLAVRKTPDATAGQLVVARLGDEVTVKRFAPQKGAIHLLAENPAYQPIVVSPTDDFVIEGLAVGLIRSWSN